MQTSLHLSASSTQGADQDRVSGALKTTRNSESATGLLYFPAPESAQGQPHQDSRGHQKMWAFLARARALLLCIFRSQLRERMVILLRTNLHVLPELPSHEGEAENQRALDSHLSSCPLCNTSGHWLAATFQDDIPGAAGMSHCL